MTKTREALRERLETEAQKCEDAANDLRMDAASCCGHIEAMHLGACRLALCNCQAFQSTQEFAEQAAARPAGAEVNVCSREQNHT